MSSARMHDSQEDIAIIGMAGRFPGASNIERYWQNLRDGVTSISFFTEEELKSAGIDQGLLRNPNYVKAGAVLDDVDLFDADFFGFTRRESELMDPQQRFFMECAWETLEEGGYDPETYLGRIGVYAGQSLNSYMLSIYSHLDVTDSAELLQKLI
jgi:acyl transferase domain-containing protein